MSNIVIYGGGERCRNGHPGSQGNNGHPGSLGKIIVARHSSGMLSLPTVKDVAATNADNVHWHNCRGDRLCWVQCCPWVSHVHHCPRVSHVHRCSGVMCFLPLLSCVGVSITNADCAPCMLALFVFIARCLDSSLQVLVLHVAIMLL